MNQFAESLRAIPGIQVTTTTLPFDLDAEKGLSGDIGAAREEIVPRFTISFTKRVQS